MLNLLHAVLGVLCIGVGREQYFEHKTYQPV